MDGVARNSVSWNSSPGGRMSNFPWWPRVATRRRTACNGTTRAEQKRDHWSFTQPLGFDLFSNKRLAIDDVSSRTSMGFQNVNVPTWQDNSQFASGQSNNSSQSDVVSSTSLDPADINSLSLGSRSYELDDSSGNGVSVDLTLATNTGNPFASFDPASFKKVEVNKVGESNYGMRITKEADLLLMGEINLPMHKPVSDENAGDNQTLSLALGLESGHGNNFSKDSSYIEGDGHLFSLYPSYKNVADNSPLFALNYLHFNPGMAPIRPPYGMIGSNFLPTGPYPYYCMSNWGNSSMGMGFRSFGPGMDQNPNSIYFNNSSMIHPHSSQALAVMNQQNSTVVTAVPAVNSKPNPTPASRTVSKPEKAAKKPGSDNFPSNVRTLLSTGIFEGVVVKYVSWARNKSLRGFISRTGYLCTCKKCNGTTESLNAFEFEQHAGAKSKHPNSHIYFQNGKSIYGVVQELQNTPLAMLFETIEKITGGPVHEKNFNIWKAKFKEASWELQRIEGKGPNVMSSSK